jgi:hypothetical protein
MIRTDSWAGWVTSPPGEEVQLAVTGQVYAAPGARARLTKAESGSSPELHLELMVDGRRGGSPGAVRYDENLATGDEYEIFVVWDSSTGWAIVEGQMIERVPWGRSSGRSAAMTVGDDVVRVMFVRYRGPDETGAVVREYFFEASDGSRHARRFDDGPEGLRFELFGDYRLDELGPDLDDPPVWPDVTR